MCRGPGRTFVLVSVVALLLPCPALPCYLCAQFRQSPSLRQDAELAQAILYGSAGKPELTAGVTGVTPLRIEAVIKPHPAVAGKKVVQLPRYIPVSDERNPPRFLVFCFVKGDKVDPYRGVPLKPSAVDYLRGALTLKTADRPTALLYFFKYLDHPEAEIARDAFLEFAHASEQELQQVSAKLSADKLRAWIKDPGTPPERLSLYAFLLGLCGHDADAILFRTLLAQTDERTHAAYDGILSGYIQLRPKEGWKETLDLLRDGTKPFPYRLAALRTLRLFHQWKPQETRPQLLQGWEAIINQGELADMAIEDLRRAQIWDLTPQVLARYGKKDFDGPIYRRAIVRYALCCPLPAAAEFIAKVRTQDAELVKDLEESVQYEQQAAGEREKSAN